MKDIICNNCNGNSFKRISYTTVKCTRCGTIDDTAPDFRIPETSMTNILDEVFSPQQQLHPASLLHRLANRIIDSFIIISFVFLLFLMSSGFISIMIIIFLPAVMLIIAPAYYTVMEYKFGKTLGKYITKTTVVSTKSATLSIEQCIIRTVCRIIPFEPFSGFVFKKIFWHDSLSHTLVIDDK